MGESKGSVPATDGVIGRQDELLALRLFLDEVRGGARAVLLEGEAGIGKTTVWQRGVELALERGYRVLQSRPAEAEARLAYATVGDLLDGVLDEVLEQLPAPQRRALEIALVLESPGAAVPDQRAIGVAILGAVRALARDGPVIVAIDDVQWLDASSAAVLGFALRRLDAERAGLLLARRGHGSDPPLGIERTALADRLERRAVGPLSLGALHHLMGHVLGATYPRPVLRRIHETSGGNPFFALELGRALARNDGRSLDEALPVTPSLEMLVDGRLAELPHEGGDPLLAAAIASAPTLDLIDAASDGAGRAMLEGAARAGVLLLDDGRVRFGHPLFASAVVRRASPDRLRAVHRRLARLVADVEERARHLALATSHPDAQVAASLDEAVARARERGAPAAAAELSELAARLTPADEHEEFVSRRFAAADAHFAAGDTGRACQILETLEETLPSGVMRSDALLRLAEAREDFSGSVELAERALAEAEGDPARAAAAENALAILWLVLRADLLRALEHHRRGVRFAEQAGDPVRLALNLAHMAHLESLTGRITPGLLERGVTLEQELGVLPDYGPSFVLGLRLMYQDRLDEARERLLHVCDVAAEQGDEPRRAYLVFHLGELECRAGNYAAAFERAAEAIDLGEQLALDSTHSGALYVGALAAAHMGRVDEARRLAEAGLERSGRRGVFMIQNASVLGFVELSVGDAAAAGERLRPLPPLLEEMGYGEPSVNRVLPNAIDALVQLGELDEARPLIARLEEQGRRLGTPYGLATGARCRGLLLAAEGDLGAAELAFERALQHHQAMPGPFERGRTLLGLGSLRRRGKQKRAAREALLEAAGIFERLGAPLWAAKARTELTRIGGRRPANGELTPMEGRVAGLVAAGRSNKEVAAELFVTVKTVEANLSRVYAKLGVHSRTQLARQMSMSPAPKL